MNNHSNKTKKTALVIGAGVIGSALSMRLSQTGLEVIVLEQGPRIAEGITSRNSGVIHAGIYYPPNSLKAKLCIEGKNLLYEWCTKKNVSHKKTGKYIISSMDEEEELEFIYKNAIESGAEKIKKVTINEIRSLPYIKGECALFSETTGIIDPYELTYSFQCEAENHGAHYSLNTKVLAIEKIKDYSYKVNTTLGEIETELIFNCAGLESDHIAKLCGINHYTLYPCRGDYFKIQKKLQIPTLIYPVKKKNAPGLGIHLTLNLDGSLKLGPDAYYTHSKEDFSDLTETTMKEKRSLFFKASQKYLNGIEESDLIYDTCGIRPKLRSPTDTEEKDFIISQDLPGFFNLIGIESPGLTASLAIAKHTLNMLNL